MLRFDINLLFTIINVLILYVGIKRFLFKPVRKIMETRQAEIEKQYEEAQKTENQAKELKQKYEASISHLAEEQEQMLKETQSKASKEYERIIADASKQANEIVCKAKENAEKEQEKRMQQAQEQIADLVVAATAKIVASKANEQEDRELYNQFLAKAGK